MRVPRYPLESQNRSFVLSEHAGNPVNNRTRVDSPEITARYPPLTVTTAPQLTKEKVYYWT
jgi:hypothetical protein